jgi:uncharacterized protein YqgV (UPF0045/DUF77 family)
MDDEEGKAGYGRPPRKNQFQKGVCPNPQGRGYKKAPAPGELFVRIHSEKIPTGDGARAPSLERMQIVIKQLAAGAIAGDLKAMETLIDMRMDKNIEFRGDGTKAVVRSSSHLMKVLELQERMSRRKNRRRRT